MEEDILNYLYQLSCFVGHPVYTTETQCIRLDAGLHTIQNTRLQRRLYRT